MDRLEYDDPRLHPKEDEIVKFKNVKIYDGNEKVRFTSYSCYCNIEAGIYVIIFFRVPPLTTEKWFLRHTESCMSSLGPQKDLHLGYITWSTWKRRSPQDLDFQKAKNSCFIYQSHYQVTENNQDF